MAGEPLLLDTHVWIWLMEEMTDRMSSACVAALERASAENRLLVSALSVWEVAMLDAARKVKLHMECGAWVERALTAPGVSLAPLDPKTAVASTRLPGRVHPDPVDRILIAAAHVWGWRLVTRDRRILNYARSGHIAVLDAGAART